MRRFYPLTLRRLHGRQDGIADRRRQDRPSAHNAGQVFGQIGRKCAFRRAVGLALLPRFSGVVRIRPRLLASCGQIVMRSLAGSARAPFVSECGRVNMSRTARIPVVGVFFGESDQLPGWLDSIEEQRGAELDPVPTCDGRTCTSSNGITATPRVSARERSGSSTRTTSGLGSRLSTQTRDLHREHSVDCISSATRAPALGWSARS
jgi:hypothetical protein